MSSYYIKTKYNVEGSWGDIEEKTIFCHHHNTCDYVNFYDEDGRWIMSVPDTIDNNILDAINKLYLGRNSDGTIDSDIEYMIKEEREKIK